MFRLPQQVSGAQLRINRIIRNDHGFCWPRKQVNPHTSVKLAFRLGHKCVSRTHQHVHGINGFCANCHRAHRLNAAHDINFMRAAHMHSRNDGRMGFAIHGRGRCDYARYTRDRCRQNRHMRRCHHREFSAWYVASNRLHGNVAVSQNDTRHCFNLDIGHGCALGLGKVADLFLRKFDILHIAR